MVGSRVYIGNLPKDTGDRDLERFFRGFGRIRDVLIKNGYGFVELDDPRDADDAVYELNGKRLLGERVTVERARGTPRGRDQWTGRGDTRHRNNFGGGGAGGGGGNNERYGPPTRTDHRLIVENLSSRVSWQDLKDYMRQAGEVTYADAHKYRNEGVVEFASYSDMKNALEKLDDTEINGRKIHLVEDRRRDKKSLSYSSRSRSRSRSTRRRSRSAASRSRSRSRSRRSSKSARRGDSKSKSRSVSRNKSVDKSKSKTRSRSRSRSAASKHSARRTRSRSASKEPEKSKHHSRSRSRSHSPEK